MGSNKEVLWLGSVLNHDGLVHYKGEAPSATQWSKGLITGLGDFVNVQVFAPMWDSLYPKGKLFPANKKFLDGSLNQNVVPYLNFPFLRTTSVALSIVNKVVKHIRKYGEPLAIVIYNTYPHYIKAAKILKKLYPRVKWITLVLDLDDPLDDDWVSFERDINGSDGSVFLSWWGFSNSRVYPKIHLDSGWDGPLPIVNEALDNNFLYAGKMSDEGGIGKLIDVINNFPDDSVYFDFYGKGKNEKLLQLAKVDKRVRLFGFVTDDQLKMACCKASVLLSPRDVDFQGTKMIFPSKILYYLKFGKPIISDRLPGLSLLHRGS